MLTIVSLSRLTKALDSMRSEIWSQVAGPNYQHIAVSAPPAWQSNHYRGLMSRAWSSLEVITLSSIAVRPKAILFYNKDTSLHKRINIEIRFLLAFPPDLFVIFPRFWYYFGYRKVSGSKAGEIIGSKEETEIMCGSGIINLNVTTQ